MAEELSLLYPAVYEVVKTAHDLAEQGKRIPPLILLYALIDTMGSLERSPGAKNQDTFTLWVEAYLLPKGNLACSAIDLYAARCAILHTLSAESDLSRKSKAIPVYYSWSPSEPALLQEVLKREKRTAVIVPFPDLLNATKLGIGAYIDEVEDDPARTAVVLRNAESWLVDLKPDQLARYLELLDERDAGLN